MTFPKQIKQPDFTLRAAVDETQATNLSALVQNNQVEFKYIPYTASLTTPEKALIEIQNMTRNWENGSHYTYLIFDMDDKLLGYVGLKIRTGGHVAEVSYYLEKSATGKGYAAHSISILSDLFFEKTGHRVEIFCNENNAGSVNLAKRLGCHLDGVMREYELIDSKFEGVVIYSKIKGE